MAPVARFVGAVALLMLVVELRRYRQAKALAAIESASAQSGAVLQSG